MAAYYNENDPFMAAWLRELIAGGHIAPGDVDERDIREVMPDDVRGYRQAHFFAGLAAWSHALRLAGWADDAAVWTGSAPCQPFSTAGRGGGTDDARHLWPEFFRLIAECRPGVVFGEQVASPAGLAWLDAVSADLEGAGYAVGACDLCAAGCGAPHLRQRLFFVADADFQSVRGEGPGAAAGAAGGVQGAVGQRKRLWADALAGGIVMAGGLADAADQRHNGRRTGDALLRGTAEPERLRDPLLLGNPGRAGAARPSRQSRDDGAEQPAPERAGSAVGDLADANCAGQRPDSGPVREPEERDDVGRRGASRERPGPVNGFWRAADWLHCTDERWRPVEPGTFPLAHGAADRVGRVRGAGNAIVAPLAAEFIAAYRDVRGD